MKLLFYGRLGDLIGREVHLAAASNCTIAQLRQDLIASHHQAKAVLDDKRVRTCVADVLVGDDFVVADTDTVEFLPPVSGG